MNTDANRRALRRHPYRRIAALLWIAAACASGHACAEDRPPVAGAPTPPPASTPPVAVPAAQSPPLSPPLPPPAPAAQGTCMPAGTAPHRPRIGLVLSGGGARGLSHIGVLKVLEELRVPVDFIAATSMGSIVGGLYASGMSVTELDKTVRSIDWTAMFSDMPPRQDLTLRRKDYTAQFPLPFELGVRGTEVQVIRGAIAGANLELWLHDRTRQDDNLGSFDELPIPFRAVATDMVTGQQSVFRHGPLYEAIRASMSVPGLFSPAEIGDRIYGDGGLVNNLPVDVVQAMGADVVIAVNIGTPLMTRNQLSSVLGVTAQSINILTEQNVREQLARLRAGDVLIEPDLGDLTFLDFSAGPRFIDLGEAAARKAADRLRPLALSPEAYAAYLAARPTVQAMAEPKVDFVQIDGTDHVNPKAIAATLDGLVGKPLDVDALTKDISSLYGSGDFDRIEYRTLDVDGRPGLRFNVSENSLGPNYLRFGLNLSTDLQGESQFNAVAGYQATWLNKWGLEWTTELELGTVRRITSELYQPLGPGSPWFTSLYGEAEREPIYLFDDEGKRLAEYSLLRVPAGLDVGYAFSRYGAIRLGYSYTHYRADLAVGAPEFGGGQTTESGVALLASFDQLDNPYFPRTGLKANVEAFTGHQTFDGESNGNVGRARMDFLQALPLSENSQLQLAGRFAWTTNNDASLATDYQLGGFLNLSGLKLDQLNGDYLGLLRGVYTYRMGQLPTIVGRSWYLGASAEIGNTWTERNQVSFGDTRKAGSVFLGLDTYLGPFYVAYGRASGGASSWYIFLGRP